MPNPPIDPTLRKQQQIQQAYSGRRARRDAIKAQEPKYDPSMPASLGNMPPRPPANPNNPPLPKQYDPSMPASLANMPPSKPVNPNNPPLPKDWKPPVNPNNPVLPQDWAPPGGIPGRAGRDEARALKLDSAARHLGYGGTSGGYHLGTDIPAPPPPPPPGAPIKYPTGQQPPSQRWGTPQAGEQPQPQAPQAPQPSAPQSPGQQVPQPGMSEQGPLPPPPQPSCHRPCSHKAAAAATPPSQWPTGR